MPLAGHGAGADGAGRTPVTRLAGGEGKGVGKQEETEGYPVVGRIRVGDGRMGGLVGHRCMRPTAGGRRRVL